MRGRRHLVRRVRRGRGRGVTLTLNGGTWGARTLAVAAIEDIDCNCVWPSAAAVAPIAKLS